MRPQWCPAGRCHRSARPGPSRSCSRSRLSTCASTRASSPASTPRPTASTPATSTRSPSGTRAARWVGAGPWLSPHLRHPPGWDLGWGFLRTPGQGGSYGVSATHAQGCVGGPALPGIVGHVARMHGPAVFSCEPQALLTQAPRGLCRGGRGHRRTLTGSPHIPLRSGPELPVRGADAAAEPGQVQCQWQLWLRAQAPVHVPG